MMGEPTSMVDRMNQTQISVPGGRVLEMLINASLTELNQEAKLQPLLADARERRLESAAGRQDGDHVDHQAERSLA